MGRDEIDSSLELNNVSKTSSCIIHMRSSMYLVVEYDQGKWVYIAKV